MTESLRRTLREIHLKSAQEPIGFPSPQGGFRDAALVAPMLVVPDANILRNDILYACRGNRRTVLVNAVNVRLLRLFCAQHVVDEVTEHAEDWTNGSDVSAGDFLLRWRLEYLPVIRVVPPHDITAALLSPEERDRIAELGRVDSDDVFTALENGPSAALEFGPACGRCPIVARLAEPRLSGAGDPPDA